MEGAGNTHGAGLERPRARWRNWLLVASLALNLLVLGAVAGALVRGGPMPGGARFDLSAGPLTRALSDADRNALRDHLRDHRAFRQNGRAAIREDMRELQRLLRAETLDVTALGAVLARQSARLVEGQNAAIEAITARVEEMSYADRIAFADRLADQSDRRLPRDGGHGPDRDRERGRD